MAELDKSISKGFEGSVFKSQHSWRVTTSVPSIPYAEIMEVKMQLKEGLKVHFDLVTILQTEGENKYQAINLEIRNNAKKNKLSPKNKDKKRNKKV